MLSERAILLATRSVRSLALGALGIALPLALEANALGTPVVARDAPGLRDSVRHEETGLLVGSEGADDIDAWTRAIASLMDEDGSTLAMRSRCLDWAGHFDWDRAAEDMEDAIAAALASERR